MDAYLQVNLLSYCNLFISTVRYSMMDMTVIQGSLKTARHAQ